VHITAKHHFASRDVAPHQAFTSDLIPEDDRDAGGLPSILTLYQL